MFVNNLYLDEIEQNIKKIQKDIDLKSRFVVLFGANKTSEKMLLSLRAKGIGVQAIIDNNPKEVGKRILGVSVKTPDEALGEYKEHAIILIASKYFWQMKLQLNNMGYKEEQIYQMVVYHSLSTTQEDFDKCVNQVRQGEQVYLQLQKEYGSRVAIIMCPYNGIGDMYLICSYLAAYCEKEKITAFVLTAVSNACVRIAKMFGVKNIKYLNQNDSDALMKYASFCGQENTGIKVLNHTTIHWDVLVSFEIVQRLDWGTIFRFVLMKIGESNKQIPIVKKEKMDTVIEFFEKNRLEKNKTAILSPYANTIVCLEDNIWDNIILLLKNLGYTVYTNSIGAEEPPLLGTTSISFPLEIAKEVIQEAGVFVGIRSGLCDVIEDAKAKIFVLYPKSSMKFFNLSAMGFGRNVVECCCETEDVVRKIEVHL